MIGGDDKRFSRVVFNEITKNAIQQAFKQPGELNIDRVNAAGAPVHGPRGGLYGLAAAVEENRPRPVRRPRAVGGGAPVVERERDIKAFVPEEYWELHADLLAKGETALQMEVTHAHDKPFKPVNREQTHAAVKLLEKPVTRCWIANKPTSSKPGAPFITSTLQQAASTRLSFGVKKP